MTQRDLERAVASATGETVSTIRHLGFTLIEPQYVALDQPAEADLEKYLDWDRVQASRVALFP